MKVSLLFADPSERQTRRQMNTGRSLLADVQFPSNGGKGQNVVITVRHHQQPYILTDDELVAFLLRQTALFQIIDPMIKWLQDSIIFVIVY